MPRAQPPVKALRAPSGRGDSFRSPLSVLVALNDSKLGHGAGIFYEAGVAAIVAQTFCLAR
jgi:hypothetical protein